MPLSDRQRKLWNENGYLVIEGFFDEPDIAAIESSLERVWHERPTNVTIDDLVSDRRIRASQVTDDESNHTFKVNDLYLVDPNVRKVVSSQRVVAVVGELLGDVPVICNTLNMEKGSQQGSHIDTLFMTPISDFALVATWMALEDVHADAGPLRYIPGSQRIEPLRFSNGQFHYIPDEMPGWYEYMDESVARYGLEEERFLAKRGDLFIWDALLYHGGSLIDDLSRTRKSLVTHFFTKTDCKSMSRRARSVETRPVESGAGMWLDRALQPIAGEVLGLVESELADRRQGERLVTAVRNRRATAKPEDQLSAVIDALTETEQQLRLARKQLAEIKRSRSWRITRPLRRIANLNKGAG
jgi:phytanoyl-CoA hydroxylase